MPGGNAKTATYIKLVLPIKRENRVSAYTARVKVETGNTHRQILSDFGKIPDVKHSIYLIFINTIIATLTPAPSIAISELPV